MTQKTQRSPITFRLKPDQESFVRVSAEKAGVSLTEFIKNRLLENFDDEQKAA